MLKPRICFVAQSIYPMLKGNSNINIAGGAELQQLFIGKVLLKRGYNVSYITKNHGQSKVEEIGMFKVVSTFKPKEGVPFLRFFYPRLPKVWRALCETDADIYYVRAAGFLLAVVVIFARLHNKKVIFCGASNSDFQPRKLGFLIARDRILYLWGLKRADSVVVQSDIQKLLLQKNFNINGQIIRNGLTSINHTLYSKETILWVGTIKEIKRPQIFIDLAKRFPEQRFVMIGGTYEREKTFYQHILEKACKVSNLDFKGFLPFSKVERYFTQTKLFVNTSKDEGFPNTFLQAWRRGIPVASFVDPDNLIKDHQLGIVVKDIDEMAQKVNGFLANKINISSIDIKSYFDSNLTIDSMVDKYEKLFSNL
ncbi:MAG: glycosyltransferase family 4 protein [Candidatus Brocadiaceae bacterium]|nr:glycosyltransferase family 4 protein [Candidatus Brocadiaceae bacterium]